MRWSTLSTVSPIWLWSTLLEFHESHSYNNFLSFTKQHMRGVFALCLIYASLPLALLALVTVLQSGFPLLPLVTGLGIFLSQSKGR